MVRKLISLINLFSVILLIGWTGYLNTGNFNGNTMGSVSRIYGNLFTPADYAFSIWGLIFIGLMVFAVYGVVIAFAKANTLKPEFHAVRSSNPARDFLDSTYPYFSLSNFFCILWIGLWLSEQLLYSVAAMVAIFVCLIMCIGKLDMEKWDAPFPIIAFVWWPLCAYSGWIGVALVANIASYVNMAYEFSTDQQVMLTMAMIAIVLLIYSAMIWKRNMREFALVGVWASVGIYIRHMDDTEMIAYTALATGILLFIQAGVHGSRNTDTNPMFKFRDWLQARKH